MKTNNETTIVPLDAPEKLMQAIKEQLKTDVIRVSIGESNLLGIYASMNNNGIIVPNITSNEELEVLKKSGFNVYRSAITHNAHGNNMVVNNHGGLINENIDQQEKKKIEDTLGIELLPARIGNYPTVGSACVSNDRGFIAHFNMRNEEEKIAAEALKVKGSRGSVNIGTGFISFGLVANNNGYIAGEKTTPFELGRVEEALDFVR